MKQSLPHRANVLAVENVFSQQHQERLFRRLLHSDANLLNELLLTVVDFFGARR